FTHEFSRASHGLIDVHKAIARERIRTEIDDAHDQRTTRKLDRVPPRNQPHGSATKEIARFCKRTVCVKPTSFASATALAKPAASSCGACASELISSGTCAAWASSRNCRAGYCSAHSFRQPAVLISKGVRVSASAAITGS